MKILLISAYFPPDTGSASHLFYELGTGLAKKGHEVKVLTGFPNYHGQGDLDKYRGRRFLIEKIDGMEVVGCRGSSLAFEKQKFAIFLLT